MMNLQKSVYTFERHLANTGLRESKEFYCDAITFDKLVKKWMELGIRIGPAQFKVYRHVNHTKLLVKNMLLNNGEKPKMLSLKDNSWLF